ncbi:hypothetical protein NQ315_011189 [Exocentrus adspersus]|uniref:PiggyBac transposable element-derived protein domain-containing protein n=1 Tax=Exocentrus adspersus TaxID=1586481 RepID=A0AAV8V9I7_9CUCU|nr:hypothetical protein NQ315_011189 [Exocentrus adspersus]
MQEKNEPTGTIAANNNGHTYNICMELTKNLLNTGRIIYMDNFYSSVKLCKDFLDLQTYMCGTLRSNRKGNPRDVCSNKLKKGEIFCQQKKKKKKKKGGENRGKDEGYSFRNICIQLFIVKTH